jgi:hypothetical protein
MKKQTLILVVIFLMTSYFSQGQINLTDDKLETLNNIQSSDLS